MTDSGNGRRLLGPFNRVEGDLEVSIEVDNGAISRAWVNAPLFRGFEQIMHGKDPRDAMAITPRICGICSVSQSVAAAQAIAAAQGLQATPNGQLATNLILAAENLADHLSHFYLFFMPDFARDCYRDQPWFESVAQRFKAQSGSCARQVLPARAQFLHLTGLLAGKWPHSLAIQPGGTTRPLQSQERIRLLSTLAAFRAFLEETLFGTPLERVAALESVADLAAWRGEAGTADFARFLDIADALDLAGLGRASDRFLSYGAYRSDNGHLFRAGLWDQRRQELDADAIREDISHSWFNSQTEPKHPYQGSTIPDNDEDAGYSWCKAPRLDGRVVEVGALARQQIDGQPLVRQLVGENGGNVRNRVVARLLEIARVLVQMEQWARRIDVGEPFCSHADIPDEARGAGLVEAARGSLGHWLRIKNGRILNYQIIAPTTWNFSPRDRDEQPGALEQALAGTPYADDARGAAAVQHVIRSFDPCMVCTVH